VLLDAKRLLRLSRQPPQRTLPLVARLLPLLLLLQLLRAMRQSA